MNAETWLTGACHCGEVRWRYRGLPASATSCNCTVCSRYGALWAYGEEGESVEVSGATANYVPQDALAFHFCKRCGCLAYFATLEPNGQGRRDIAVNLRMGDPEQLKDIPMRRWEGRHSWSAAPAAGRTLGEHWF